jgi:hypothetical protein
MIRSATVVVLVVWTVDTQSVAVVIVKYESAATGDARKCVATVKGRHADFTNVECETPVAFTLLFAEILISFHASLIVFNLVVELTFGLNEIRNCEHGEEAENLGFHGGERNVRNDGLMTWREGLVRMVKISEMS